MTHEKVAAAVLTYNRLALLKECIAAIKAQSRKPDAVIVVDNGSAEDTSDWLRGQEGLTVISIASNIGPAAGISTALREAYKTGCDWIWIMDDDGLPHADALKNLTGVRPGVPCAKNSVVLDKVDRKTLVFKLLRFKTIDDIKEEIIEGEIMPWNGTLLHRQILERLGYPHTDLFLWGEEMEYYFRIKTSGLFPLFSVRSSWHFHPRNKGFFYKGGWDVRTHDRAYFFIRNKYAVYLAAHKRNKFKAGLHYLLFGSAMVYYVLFRQPLHKGKKLKLLSLAFKDGITTNYKKRPADVQALLQRL